MISRDECVERNRNSVRRVRAVPKLGVAGLNPASALFDSVKREFGAKAVGAGSVVRERYPRGRGFWRENK